jgi:hypothetical protein
MFSLKLIVLSLLLVPVVAQAGINARTATYCEKFYIGHPQTNNQAIIKRCTPYWQTWTAEILQSHP